MSEIKAGVYKGSGVAGSEQYGRTPNGTDQIVLELAIPELERNVQTFLYCSEKALPFTIERLRALGWDNDDITNLSGIDKNEVSIDVHYEAYDKGDGSGPKQQMRVNILSGGGRVQIEQFVDSDKRAFKARVAAMMGKKPEAGGGNGFPFGANEPPTNPPKKAAAPAKKAGF